MIRLGFRTQYVYWTVFKRRHICTSHFYGQTNYFYSGFYCFLFSGVKNLGKLLERRIPLSEFDRMEPVRASSTYYPESLRGWMKQTSWWINAVVKNDELHSMMMIVHSDSAVFVILPIRYQYHGSFVVFLYFQHPLSHLKPNDSSHSCMHGVSLRNRYFLYLFQ